MTRIADAAVTGFAKSRALAEASLSPLRRLRQENLLRRIVCVTWDTPDTDAYADWIGAMDGVTLKRVPQPQVNGTCNQRGIVYQIEALRAALAHDAELTLKSRPDYVFDTGFLRRKLESFDAWSTIPQPKVLGVAMPKPAFESRIWIPWADSSQPFYYEDAAFLGRTRDIAKLVTTVTAAETATLGDARCGSFVHVLRYAKPFLADYPLFASYLRNYRYFGDAIGYRRKLVPHVTGDGFFWYLLVAHAWILHSHFHVDAGRAGELSFHSNTANPGADWSKLETLRLANPYDNLETWRAGAQPGKACPSVQRFYGRLVDDAWQSALFAQPLADFPQAALARILENVAQGGDGRFKGVEGDFYRGLANLHALHGQAAMAEAG